MNKRVFILLFDSFGVGSADDAQKFGDKGADTFGHIVAECFRGNANKIQLRQGPLLIPNLTRLGLVNLAEQARGQALSGMKPVAQPQAMFGYAQEISFGKDTPSGHWEIAGVPVLFDWGYFPPEYPSFPDKLVADLIQRAKLPGILGNKHASGTDILQELGEEHIKTGKPIVYTSADSVFQIAAHEKYFGLQRLYDICLMARELVDEYNIGRVIARPFVGEAGQFSRTGNRRDYATLPPAPTLLDKMSAQGYEVISIGKIADIYAHQGITQKIKADGNRALFDATLRMVDQAPNNSLTFTNFVDFDSSYGHRRDVAGYAAALEEIDRRLPELEAKLRPGDMVVITADHGCDPTWPGSDHTREFIPILMFGPNISAKNIGKRKTFADIGQTIADFFSMKNLDNGTSFLN